MVISIIDWIVIGAIQGITEWLPISSKTAVLLYAARVMGLDLSTSYLLAFLMEGSTALAGILYLREDYLSSAKAIFGGASGKGRNTLMFLLISLGLTGAVGLPLMLFVEKGAASSATFLTFTALAFLAMAYLDFSRKNLGIRTASSVTPIDSAVVGVLQGIAVVPGVSRSAVTTLGLLFRGFRTGESFRLSFFTGVLATIGATLVSLVRTSLGTATGLDAEGILVAWIVGAVVGLLCIRTLIELAAKLKVWQLSIAMAVLTLLSLFLF